MKAEDRRAETERVIAHVRAEIPPGDQAQTLRDLARGADGEPQLDEGMLEREARIVELGRLVRRLRDGMGAWASDDDGVHPDAWDAFADACEVLGEQRPCPECGAPPCDPDCPEASDAG